MKAKIKSIYLENFKGVKSAIYILDGKSTKITGQNGAGKTTLFSAWLWLFADRDAELHSNPAILPLGAQEVSPRVEFTLDIDGREVAIAKIQKCTVKKSKGSNGADQVSLSNSYEVNAVEYGERDFKKKMQEYGFDFDLFLPLSHPDVFTGQKSADMRKVLFGMTSEKTDKEIAAMTPGAEMVAQMLESYNLEEIAAMQKATLRKIKDVYGDKGEILRATIAGKESDKTEIDVAELELHRNLLNEQIDKNKAAQEDISKQFEEQQKASDGVLELRLELNGLQQKANLDLEKRRREIRTEIDDIDRQLKEIAHQIWLDRQGITSAESAIKNDTARINVCGQKWTSLNSQLEAEQERLFDDSSLVCSYCGQEYPEERKNQQRGDFERCKAKEIERIRAEMESVVQQGNDLRAAIKKDEAEVEHLKAQIHESEKFKVASESRIAELETQYNAIPQTVDISDREDVMEIQRQIAEKEFTMSQCGTAEEMRAQLKAEGEDLQKQLIEIEKQFTLVKKNIEIDEQIAELREEGMQHEQNKATAEGIQDQIKMVNRKKNELLTEAVNSHFKLVKFRLFNYLKNGDVVNDCEPLIDQKSLKEHSNGALKVLAKLDIVSGLQAFYDQYYPVFADDFSLVTDNTESRIDMDCQLIKLVAEKGVKELRVEVE